MVRYEFHTLPHFPLSSLHMKVENGARVERVTNGEIKVTVKKNSEGN